MISLLSFSSRSYFLTAARMTALLLAASAFLSGGRLLAENPHKISLPELAYFDDFKLTPETHAAQKLSIGIDLVNGNHFNYTGAASTETLQTDAASGSLNPYRTAVLIMGIVFTVATFAQALIPLIKSAIRAPVPVGVAHENQRCA